MIVGEREERFAGEDRWWDAEIYVLITADPSSTIRAIAKNENGVTECLTAAVKIASTRQHVRDKLKHVALKKP